MKKKKVIKRCLDDVTRIRGALGFIYPKIKCPSNEWSYLQIIDITSEFLASKLKSL